MIHGALHHGLGHRRAVPGKNVLFQAAAVDADADGNVFGIAGIGHCLDPVVVADVAGIDADFIGAGINGRQRRLIVKMDIRHNRNVHHFLDGRHHGGIGGGGHRDADNLAARFGHPLGLLHVTGNVLDRNVQHGLHRDGVAAADGEIADPNRPFELTHGRRLLLFVTRYILPHPAG